ncbi:MAG: hypothetical protein GX295_04170 [Syntrophomonadaceae bacterium]|nr:hypothetical protein [Syntrophomonadaceae bacterium]
MIAESEQEVKKQDPQQHDKGYRQLANHESFEKHLVDFRYILFDVNRYQKEELLQMANLISSILLLDQKIDRDELINRLWLLAGRKERDSQGSPA